MNLNQLSREAHKTASTKGFHDYKEITPTLVLAWLALVHSEVSEATEEARNKDFGLTTSVFFDGHPTGFPSELADILIRVFDIAGALKIDLDKAVKEKMAYNKTRPRKHGKRI